MLYIEENIIYLTRGDDGAIDMQAITDAQGNAYEIQEGDVLTLTVRTESGAESPVIFQTASVPGSGRMLIRGADTVNAEPGRYSADIQLTTADGLRFTIWPQLEGSQRYKSGNFKNFVIMPEVTTE